MVKPDTWIWAQATEHQMIVPCMPATVGNGIISYGLSSYGYDMRIGSEYKVFTNTFNRVVDPKAINPQTFVDVQGLYCDIPPNSFALARSVERFKIPRNILCIVLGKSTYARAGLIVNVTPLEPEWEGEVTIELSNTTPLPVRVYSNEGIAQVIFLEGDPCETSYADKKGKYQHQTGITLAKVIHTRRKNDHGYDD